MSDSADTCQSTHPIPQGFADGVVIHHRLQPKRHRFKYHMSWCLLDLDDLSSWDKASGLWQHNRWGVFAIKDRDYINAEQRPTKDKLSDYI